jgi:hypothetical protein
MARAADAGVVRHRRYLHSYLDVSRSSPISVMLPLSHKPSWLLCLPIASVTAGSRGALKVAVHGRRRSDRPQGLTPAWHDPLKSVWDKRGPVMDANRDPLAHLERRFAAEAPCGDDLVTATQLIAVLHH